MKLSDPVTTIKGVGDKTKNLLEKIGIITVGDSLTYYPNRYRKYEIAIPFLDAIKTFGQESDEVFKGDDAILVKIQNPAILKQTKRMPIVVYKHEMAGEKLEVVWYRTAFVKSTLKIGEEFVFCGKLERSGKGYKMEHPEIFPVNKYRQLEGKYLPVYSTTKGLSQNTIRNIVKEAINLKEEGNDYLPDGIIKNAGLDGYDKCLRMIHFPDDLDLLKNAYKRFAFDELFMFCLAMKYEKLTAVEQENKIVIEQTGLAKNAMEKLPFTLTDAQKKALSDIFSDIGDPKHIMKRLIQGDVGSGKTIVAFLAMLEVCENGYQSALMAPTEVLARQHYNNFVGLKEMLGLDEPEIIFLSGSLSAAQKRDAYERMQTIDKAIVVGTNALIQKKAVYKNLGLVVTDEQHRFGVKQREGLEEKSNSPHVLVMSATPIPRTLAIILYGDLDVTVIDELPAKRLPIKNCVVGESYRKTAYRFIEDQVKAGHQCYIICSMIETSENVEAQSVEEYTKELSSKLNKDIRIGKMHGKMLPKDKDKIMGSFACGDIDVLVSTTVVEVGVDVPNATVMMIEDSGRFGLAALHQLRGRVGRGEAQSYCIFMNSSDKDEVAERLGILNKTNDGFVIAEEDLKLRGPGDFFGIRQSGDFNFKIADIYRDSDLLKSAAREADILLKKDRELSLPENNLIKMRLSEFYEKIVL